MKESDLKKADEKDLEDIYLETPDFSEEKVLGYRVGIRPYRKSGIRLETEYLNNKLIIHNYGYGGSGLTLCWGGAQEALDLLKQEKTKNPENFPDKTVAILGAGIIGLATAYDLLAQGYQVNIYADSFSPDLTSNVAVGILSATPIQEDEPEKQIQLLSRITEISAKRFMKNAFAPDPEFSGVKSLIEYRFEREVSGFPLPQETKFRGIHLEERRVRVHFDNGEIKRGKQIRELGLDGKVFINDLIAQIKSKGASIQKKFFEDKNDLGQLDEKVVINCTSLGSGKLFKDKDFIPVRGHLIDFKPQMGRDYALYHFVQEDPDYWVKLYPWEDRLILGGMFERDFEGTEIDQRVVRKLLNYARACFKTAGFTEKDE